MTTAFFIIVGFIATPFLLLMAILHVGSSRTEPKPPLVYLNPGLFEQCEHSWQARSGNFSVCVKCGEEKER